LIQHDRSRGPDMRLPLYRRVHDALAADIAARALRPGEALPGEETLAARYGVALGTMRKAIEGLVAEGRLERQHGRGTFVRRADFGNALFRFFRFTDTSGAPLRPTARLLSRKAARADAGMAAHLGLAPGAPTIELFRLRLVGSEKILAERIAVCGKRFAPLLTLVPDQFGDLLYPLYESACGEIIARAREHLSFGTAAAPIAKALGLPRNAPVAVVARTAFGHDGRPLEYRRSFGPAERFSYTVEIK